MSSFDEYIEIQQQLMDRLNSLIIPLIDSAPSGAIEAAIRLNQMSYSPIQESSGLYSNIFASVQERLDSLTNGYASSLATALQNPAILVADFQRIISPDILQNLNTLNTLSIEQFSIAFKPLFSAIDNIHVSSDYVEVPEELIPENFIKNTDTIQSQPLSDIKRLSFSDAVTLITLIITILAWLFPNPFSHFQSESEIQAPTTITEEQGELIIEYLIKLYEQMNVASTHQNNSDKPLSVSDSNSPCIQFEAATPSSEMRPNLEVPSANDNIQAQSKVE